jgi:hypothetical protein
MRLFPVESRFHIRRTRALGYALLGFCTALILFGPQIAELGLNALGCPVGFGTPGANCRGFAGLLAAPLAPWSSAVPPVETVFLLFDHWWGLLLVWAALIVLSGRIDRRDGPAGARQPVLQSDASCAAVTALGPRGSVQAQQAQWVQARQAEQQAEARASQQSLTRQLLAESVFWGGIAVSCWVLLGGLLVFCIAFGTPLLGGLSAQSLLAAFGCPDLQQSSMNPLAGFCGFWTERLAPYQQPFFGALLSPLWLFTQFHDLLLVWLGLVLLLALLPLYRFGWLMLVVKEQAIASRVVFTLFVLSSLALVYFQFFDAPAWVRVSEQLSRVADPSPEVSLLTSVLQAGAVLLVVLVVSAFSLTAVLASRASKSGAQGRGDK